MRRIFHTGCGSIIEDGFDDKWMSITDAGVTIAVGAVLIAENADRKYDRILQDNLGYLRNYSLEPGHSMTGHLMAKDVPAAKHLVVDVPLDTRVYRFILLLR